MISHFKSIYSKDFVKKTKLWIKFIFKENIVESLNTKFFESCLLNFLLVINNRIKKIDQID